MKFEVSTKPLNDGLGLAIINSNISQFYAVSCIVQVSATSDTLRINAEVPFILSEIILKGKGDSAEPATVFVDSLNFKQLVSTLDSSTIIFEFVEGGLVLHSGKSKFTLPAMNPDTNVELSFGRPSQEAAAVGSATSIKKDSWKVIKDRQLYALGMSIVAPVYNRVWISENNDVLAGNYDESMFTHSASGTLNKTCLLSDTIINLFNEVPDNSVIYEHGNDYVIKSVTDGYTYLAQITPQYEDDQGVGSYNADIIFDMFPKSDEKTITVPTANIKKAINQSLILSTDDKFVTLGYKDNCLVIHDGNVDVSIEVGGECQEFDMDFNSKSFQSIIKSYGAETVKMSPLYSEGELTGVAISDGSVVSILAGADPQ